MRKNILVTPLMAVLATGALYSQDTDGTITGRVTGPNNNPLQGVRVSITSPSLLTPRSARTDANGQFRVPILPSGHYSITYSLDGFISRRSSATLVAGTTVNASTKLQSITSQSATVDITATGSTEEFIQIDKTDTTVQTVFTSQRMNEIVGTAVSDIAKLTPGVQGNFESQYTNSPDFRIRGSFVRGIKFVQDGQVVSDALRGTASLGGLAVEDTIESIAIVQSPLNAKLGDSDGGLISITTKKGTNDFSGSLRWTGNRNTLWTSRTPVRQNRWGLPVNAIGVGDDNMSKSWDFTLRGPIVPGYLTFSYAGTIRPSTRTTAWFRNAGAGSGGTQVAAEWNPNPTTISSSPWDGDVNRRLGTWYQSPEGDIIRKPDWWSVQSWDSTYEYTRSAEGNINSFNLYLQIAEGQTASYYYQQSTSENITNGAYDMGEASNEYGQKNISRNWNLSYRGILGAYGVLDARYGKSSSFRDTPKGGGITVTNRFWATYYDRNGYAPDDPRANSANFDNYAGSGIIDLIWSRWDIRNPNASTGAGADRTWLNLRAVTSGDAWFRTIGYDRGSGDGSENTTMSLGYSHIVDFYGSHMIDVGFNRTIVDVPAINDNAPYLFDPVGQIDRNLTQAQIANMYGSPVGSANNYRGRYIVWDVRNTTFGALEPQAVNRPNYLGQYLPGNELIWDASRSTNTVSPGLAGTHPLLTTYVAGMPQPPIMNETALLTILPYMRMLSRQADGKPAGRLYTTTGGYYVNDMWTINNNHSIMLGIRADSFDFGDGEQTVHKYTKFTPRFEYKFDPFGDQKHLFAFSYAQFHQMANASLYLPFLTTEYNSTAIMLWSPPSGATSLVDGSPLGGTGYQLVRLEDLSNPDNYTLQYSRSVSSSLDNKLDPGFRPPTSKEISLWYRRSFANGGTWKISYSRRSWDDLYDYFMGDPYTYSGTTRRQTILKNTKEFERSYQGVELQWDAPINNKIAFGGHYTYSRFESNQSAFGASSSAPSASNSRVPWQMPEYWDNRYNWLLTREANDQPGVYNPGTGAWFFSQPAGFGVGGYGLGSTWSSGRDMWSPILRSGSEYNLYWYLTINLSQGKVRTTLSLTGSFEGASERYDTLPIIMGYPYVPGLNTYTGTYGGGQVGGTMSNAQMTTVGGELVNGHVVVVNRFTGVGTMTTGNLRYTMTMPIVRKLSWTIQGDVYNLFNHFYKRYDAPRTAPNARTDTDYTTAGQSLGPNQSPGAAAYTVAYNGALQGTNLAAYVFMNGPFFGQRDSKTTPADLGGYYGSQNSGGTPRYITLSTGLRF